MKKFMEAESTGEDQDFWVAGSQGAHAMSSYFCK